MSGVDMKRTGAFGKPREVEGKYKTKNRILLGGET